METGSNLTYEFWRTDVRTRTQNRKESTVIKSNKIEEVIEGNDHQYEEKNST